VGDGSAARDGLFGRSQEARGAALRERRRTDPMALKASFRARACSTLQKTDAVAGSAR
jgi:hypothetical protein